MSRNSILSYDFYTDSLASYLKFQNEYGDFNKDEHKKRKNMCNFLISTIKSSLTKRQFYCFWHFYAENETLQQIAKKLEIDESTVSRHITAAKTKIRRHMEYFYSSDFRA